MFNFCKEFLLTFSNKPSFFASKKIERFIVFIVFIVITIVYIAFHMKTLSATDFVFVIATWLSYGGVNSLLIQKDKQIENKKEKDDGTKVD